MKKSYIIYYFILLFYIISAVYLLINIIPNSVFPSSLSPQIKHITRTTFMEQFGFFTRDPKSSEYSLFEITENNILKKVPIKNAEKYNYYGLARINRRKLIELGKFEQKIKNKWKNGNLDVAMNNISQEDFLVVDKKRDKITQFEKGKYLLVRTSLILWEWRKFNNNEDIDYIYVEII